MLPSIFDPFVKNRPLSVMARGAMERLLSPLWINRVFAKMSDGQYTRDLLFSSVFGLMIRVVLSQAKSIRYAYMDQAEDIVVSLTSVYNKLNGVSPAASASLVRESGLIFTEAIDQVEGRNPPLLPGFTVFIVDGNAFPATEHRIDELRTVSAGPLPGKALVVFNPDLGCVIDMVPCEDAHTQERKILVGLLPMAKRGQLWLADRNFTTRRFLFGLATRRAAFLVREHKQLPVEDLGPVRYVGETETGTVFEQAVRLHPGDEEKDGQTDKKAKPQEPLTLRRVIVRLKDRTRDGDKEIQLLTNLPKSIKATTLADLYRKRWKIETAFQELKQDFNSEIKTLGYPRAAIFAFATALVAYNVMALVKGTLRAYHGAEKIENELSAYYVAAELERSYDGMMTAIPGEHWYVFAEMTHEEFAGVLVSLAEKVDLKKYPKSRRGPKKPRPERIFDPKTPHVSTARILAGRKR